MRREHPARGEGFPASRKSSRLDPEALEDRLMPVAGVPDGSAAGTEGALPEGFMPWQRGVTCTARPAWLAPFDPDRTYLANVTVQRLAPLRQSFADYGSLYGEAMTIVRRHQHERAGRAAVRSWIQAHAWFRIELPDVALVSATLTLGLSANPDAMPAAGEPVPSAVDLRKPSGGSPEAFARKHEDAAGQRRIDHLYTDFDRSGGATGDITLSYGEYASEEPRDCSRFIARVGRFVQAYDPSLELQMREWRATRTDKTNDLPWIVVSETYLRAR